MKRVALVILLSFFFIWNAYAQPVDSQAKRATPSSEGLEMIAQRMKTLSRGLSEMPAPPEMDKKIMIPDLGSLARSARHPERSAGWSSGGRPLGHPAPSGRLGEGSQDPSAATQPQDDGIRQ